jgi:chromosomal replication initiator protein
MILTNSTQSISIREVQQTVARAFNLSIAEMLSPCRTQRVTCTRHIAMYLSREVAIRRWRSVDRIEASGTDGSRTSRPPSFPRIGIAFSRDHSSVMHAYKLVKRRLGEDSGFASLIDRIANDVREHSAIAASTKEAA